MLVKAKRNQHNVVVRAGEYWTHEEQLLSDGHIRIMQIESITKKTGAVIVQSVKFKRKGTGVFYSYHIDDFGKISGLRRATPEEIAYFEKRLKVKSVICAS